MCVSVSLIRGTKQRKSDEAVIPTKVTIVDSLMEASKKWWMKKPQTRPPSRGTPDLTKPKAKPKPKIHVKSDFMAERHSLARNLTSAGGGHANVDVDLHHDVLEYLNPKNRRSFFLFCFFCWCLFTHTSE